MYQIDYESLRCDILLPELERIISKKDVTNPSFDHLKDLLKSYHYSFMCEADEAMYNEISDSSYRRSYGGNNSYTNNGNGSYANNSYGGGYYRNVSQNPSFNNGSYYRSGHNEKEKAIADLQRMMNETTDQEVKRAIQETLNGMMR